MPIGLYPVFDTSTTKLLASVLKVIFVVITSDLINSVKLSFNTIMVQSPVKNTGGRKDVKR